MTHAYVTAAKELARLRARASVHFASSTTRALRDLRGDALASTIERLNAQWEAYEAEYTARQRIAHEMIATAMSLRVVTQPAESAEIDSYFAALRKAFSSPQSIDDGIWQQRPASMAGTSFGASGAGGRIVTAPLTGKRLRCASEPSRHDSAAPLFVDSDASQEL